MFETPAAKRLKRSELFSVGVEVQQSDLRFQDEAEQEHQQDETGINYGFEYDFVQEHQYQTSLDQQAQETDEYQFNLFRPSSKPIVKLNLQNSESTPKVEAQPPLISLRSPSPDATFNSTATCRPSSYYFTSSLPQATLTNLRKSYNDSAISTTALLKKSQFSWPGTSLPWRVIHLPAHRKQVVIHNFVSQSTATLPTEISASEDKVIRRRTRPSKKRRDLLKLKAAKRQALIDESKTKEEHEREKKNRKNRERKLKRRAKERREKDEKRAGAELESENRMDEESSIAS